MILLKETSMLLGQQEVSLLHDIEPNNGFLNNEYAISFPEFKNHLVTLLNHSKGIDLPEGWVPYTTYWLYDNDVPVGMSRFRHHLNDYLERFGGHVGYAVARQHRGKGYGNHLLRLTIEKAEDLGMKELLLTCSSHNTQSRRIILNNGGILKDIRQEICYFTITV